MDTYWNSIVYSGKPFVRSLGKPKSDLVNGGSSEKSLSDIKSFLAKSNGNCAIACDPNARPVVEAVRAASAYISTMWNKTDDLHPWDFGDNYVCHMTWSSVKPPRMRRGSCARRWMARAASRMSAGLRRTNPRSNAFRD